jgi:outer membrane protein assembly factor BamD
MNTPQKNHIRNSLVLLFLFNAVLGWSCGSSNVQQNLTADQRFELGKQKFDKGDYLDAIAEFDIVRLQFPGSTVADKAQYFLAESRFMQEEYLVAAEDYQALKRNMAASPLAPVAQYKIAMCYYNLSPKAPLDQTYTLRAIDEFQTFIEYNPTHELVHDSEEKIKELNTRLAKKLYESGILYMKMEYYKAATIYFSDVVERYHDTQYAEPALFGKINALCVRKKYTEAKPEAEKYLEKYPSGSHRSEAESLLRDINDHLKGQSSALFPEDTKHSYLSA